MRHAKKENHPCGWLSASKDHFLKLTDGNRAVPSSMFQPKPVNAVAACRCSAPDAELSLLLPPTTSDQYRSWRGHSARHRVLPVLPATGSWCWHVRLPTLYSFGESSRPRTITV